VGEDLYGPYLIVHIFSRTVENQLLNFNIKQRTSGSLVFMLEEQTKGTQYGREECA
jgi:hypothetical protein